jgi:hypothetical protein
VEVLIAAPRIPVGGLVVPVGLLVVSGGLLVVDGLAPAGAGGGVGGSALAVRTSLAIPIGVVVLSPLVVISLDLASVVLVVVGSGLDGVVRFAPSAVAVGAVGLLGPLVVVVALNLSGTSPVGLGGRELLALGRAGGGISVLGGSTGEIAVLAPGLSAPLVVICVVPLVVGLGLVGLGGGLAVGLVDGEILIAAPGVPVGGVEVGGLFAGTGRSGVLLSGGLDDLGDRLVGDLGEGASLLAPGVDVDGVDGHDESGSECEFHIL